MNIRYYQDSEYEQVKSILKEGELFDAVWDSRAHLKAKIKKDPASILVAEDDQNIIGCIFIVLDEWMCFLYRLAVKESHRSKGVGSVLLSSAEEQLKKHGIDEVAIFVDESNTNLQQYYEKRGYIKGGIYRCLYKKLQSPPDEQREETS